ncbi:hypothetical protein B0H12DRAFT_840088 [Mycena haematopus]|nr:hypothetical protein B0H12DRAFT_840088 [Mycena haematopus]
MCPVTPTRSQGWERVFALVPPKTRRAISVRMNTTPTISSLSTPSFIESSSRNDIRIWGWGINDLHCEPQDHHPHWEFFEGNPFELIKRGYDVLNSASGPKATYPQTLNLTRIFAGGAFAPKRGTRRATIQGWWATWNDYGPNATTVSEAYYDALPALADKQCGGVLTRAQYDGRRLGAVGFWGGSVGKVELLGSA